VWPRELDKSVPKQLRQWPIPGNGIPTALALILQFCANFRLSIVDACTELIVVENADFVVGISTLSLIVPQIWAFPVWAAMSLYIFQLSVAVAKTRNHLSTLYVSSPLHGRNPEICRWNFNSVCYSFSDISISGFVGYFRLPLVDEMAWEQFLLSLCGRNPGLPLENNTRTKTSGALLLQAQRTSERA